MVRQQVFKVKKQDAQIWNKFTEVNVEDGEGLTGSNFTGYNLFIMYQVQYNIVDVYQKDKTKIMIMTISSDKLIIPACRRKIVAIHFCKP